MDQKRSTGLILEELQDLPNTGTTIKIDNMVIEIVKTNASGVEIARVIQASVKNQLIRDFYHSPRILYLRHKI